MGDFMDIESRINRQISDPPGGGGLGGASLGSSFVETPKNHEVPEVLRRRTEARQDRYTVVGGYEIDKYKDALDKGDIQSIRAAFDESLAYMEGLTWGVDARDYGLEYFQEDDRAAKDLQGKFENIEDSVDRESFGQVFLAISAVDEAIKHARDFAKEYYDPTDEENEKQKQNKWNQGEYKKHAEYYSMLSMQNVRSGLPGYTEKDIKNKALTLVRERRQRLISIHESTPDLKGLRNHFEARIKIFERIFTDRQKASEDEDDWFERNKNMLKPDKAHWMALFQGNRIKVKEEDEEGNITIKKETVTYNGDEIEGMSQWGHSLDQTGKAIVRVVTGREKVKSATDNSEFDGSHLLMQGWKSTHEFVSFVNTVSPYTEINGVPRMDVLREAWVVFLASGHSSKLAWGVAEVKKGGKILKDKDSRGRPLYRHRFGVPPFAEDAMTKMIHVAKVAVSEAGYPANNRHGEIVDFDEWALKTVDGDFIRQMNEDDYQDYMKYAQENRIIQYKGAPKTGYRWTMGRWRRLVDEYESAAKLEKWKDPRTGKVWEDVSIRFIADERVVDDQGNVVKQEMSRADPRFPFSEVELRTGDEPVNELAAGTWGTWHLDKIRASIALRKIIRAIHTKNDLTRAYFQDPAIRHLDRLGQLDAFAHHMEAVVIDLAMELNTQSDGEREYLIINGKKIYMDDDRIQRTTDYLTKMSILDEEEAYMGNEITIYDVIALAEQEGAISRKKKMQLRSLVKVAESTEEIVEGIKKKRKFF